MSHSKTDSGCKVEKTLKQSFKVTNKTSPKAIIKQSNIKEKWVKMLLQIRP